VLRGATRGPNACAPHLLWLHAQATGSRIVKLIGYDCGRANLPRPRNFARLTRISTASIRSS
jgi:hypothetical protein